MVRVREELPEDINAIHLVNIRAFGRTQEADVIDKLRRNCSDLLSLVAVRQNEIVGHILFSPAIVETEDRTTRGMGLAPMAVRPEYQRQGIGSELIRAGIAELISVLGGAGLIDKEDLAILDNMLPEKDTETIEKNKEILTQMAWRYLTEGRVVSA